MQTYVNIWAYCWIRLGLKNLLKVVEKDKILFIQICQFENRPMGYNCKKSSCSKVPKLADERSTAWRYIASICIKMHLVIVKWHTQIQYNLSGTKFRPFLSHHRALSVQEMSIKSSSATRI